MRCLVTGGAGFIGSHVAGRLLDEGAEVTVIDDFSSGRESNLGRLEGRARLVRASILDAAALRDAMKGASWVFHLAARPAVEGSVRDPAGTNAVNLDGSLGVLLAARDEGVAGVVFSSTCAVYGLEPRLPAVESDTPAPLSPYAVQKLAVEQYAAAFKALFGLRTFCLRYFNVFGPRQDPGSSYGAVIPRFVEALCSSRAPVIFGDGKQTRDFVYVDDVADANIRCMSAPAEAAGVPINIASGRSASVNELAAAIALAVGRGIEPRHGPARPGDVHNSRGDASRAKRLLGWEARTSLNDGLMKTVEHFRAARGAAGADAR